MTAATETVTDGRAGAAPERYVFVHGLRGIAALIVVWSHLSGFWLMETARTSVLQDAWSRWVVRPFHVFQNGGHLGVVLFFLISGFIITHSSLREDRQAFLVKRSFRIFPPLCFALAVCAVMLAVATRTGTVLHGVRDPGATSWALGAFVLDGFVPEGRVLEVTWTLVIELVFYTMTFALIPLSRTAPLRATWIMTGAWAVLTVLFMEIPALATTANAFTPVYVGFLLVGRLTYLAHRGLARRSEALVLGVLVLAAYATFQETLQPGFLLTPGGWSGVEPALTYVYALVAFFALMLAAPRHLVAPLRFLGDVSYSLYLLHIPVGITVLNLLAAPDSISTVVAIAASLAASALAYRLVEVPAQNAGRALLRRRTSGTPRAGGGTPRVRVTAGTDGSANG